MRVHVNVLSTEQPDAVLDIPHVSVYLVKLCTHYWDWAVDPAIQARSTAPNIFCTDYDRTDQFVLI